MLSVSTTLRRLALPVLASLSFVPTVSADEITGAGSSFAYPILSKWSTDYNAKTGDKLNYQSIGSGAGIAQIKAATVTFGASDKPLTADELSAAGLAQFPVVIGGVVPVFSLDGVEPGKLKLTGAVLAGIFLGSITKWDDPAIVKLNPGLKLPDAAITVVHRSDSSGTTFNFVNFLSKVSPEWKAKVGEGTSVSWPVGIGGKGNEGVAGYVKQIKNSIGYVEYAYVKQNKMDYAQVQNHAGKFIQPSADSFQAAAVTADWKNAQDFNLVITDAPGPSAYPIAASVFVIMYKEPKDAPVSKAALKFFRWALENGQPQAKELDYVALPPALVKMIEAYWKQNIKVTL